jgi:hypothetical protein
VTIIPIILSSDKTHLGANSGIHGAWPIYMTIGNVTGFQRFRPENRAMRLVGMFPEPPGMTVIIMLMLM